MEKTNLSLSVLLLVLLNIDLVIGGGKQVTVPCFVVQNGAVVLQNCQVGAGAGGGPGNDADDNKPTVVCKPDGQIGIDLQDTCMADHDIDFNTEMMDTQMLDYEHNCIPAAWEGYDCDDHPILIGKGEFASGDG